MDTPNAAVLWGFLFYLCCIALEFHHYQVYQSMQFFFLYSIKPGVFWRPVWESRTYEKDGNAPKPAFIKSLLNNCVFKVRAECLCAAQRFEGKMSSSDLFSQIVTHMLKASWAASPSVSSAFNWLCLYQNVRSKDWSIKHCISPMLSPCHDEKMHRLVRWLKGNRDVYSLPWCTTGKKNSKCS